GEDHAGEHRGGGGGGVEESADGTGVGGRDRPARGRGEPGVEGHTVLRRVVPHRAGLRGGPVSRAGGADLVSGPGARGSRAHAHHRTRINAGGLDQVARRLLRTLVAPFRGRPVGLDTLAASVNEEPSNLEEVYEPYLLQQGYLSRTQRGRVAAPRAFEYLGIA